MTIADKSLAAARQKGLMTAEQVEAYRKAIAPVQASLATQKTTRQQAFFFLRSRGPAERN
jgi:hypothetical protein